MHLSHTFTYAPAALFIGCVLVTSCAGAPRPMEAQEASPLTAEPTQAEPEAQLTHSRCDDLDEADDLGMDDPAVQTLLASTRFAELPKWSLSGAAPWVPSWPLKTGMVFEVLGEEGVLQRFALLDLPVAHVTLPECPTMASSFEACQAMYRKTAEYFLCAETCLRARLEEIAPAARLQRCATDLQRMSQRSECMTLVFILGQVETDHEALCEAVFDDEELQEACLESEEESTRGSNVNPCPWLTLLSLVMLDEALQPIRAVALDKACAPQLTSVQVTDLDGDGRHELALAYRTTDLSWDQESHFKVFDLERSTLQLSLSNRELDASPSHPTYSRNRISTEDVNGDGHLDYVYETVGSNHRCVRDAHGWPHMPPTAASMADDVGDEWDELPCWIGYGRRVYRYDPACDLWREDEAYESTQTWPADPEDEDP